MNSKLWTMRGTASSRKGLLDLIETNFKNKDNLIALQIGSYAGQSTQLFLSTGKIKQIYCVDPWQIGYDLQDEASFTADLAEAAFDKRFSKDSRVFKIKGYSFVEVPRLLDNFFDFVYIDGCHKQEAVTRDLELSFSKVKVTGVLAGHDYGPLPNQWLQVVNAVNGFLQRKPEHVFQDFSWSCKKELIRR